MSVDVKLPIGPFLRLSIVDYRATLPKGTELSAKMLEEALTSAHDAWHLARKKKRGTPLTEEQFLAQLKADPLLAGIDFAKELAACQYWCRNKVPAVKCSRMRVVNWMKRAVGDSTVANPGGANAASHAPLPDPGPKAWLEWARENLPDWKRFQTGGAVPPWHLLESTERHAIRTQMQGGKV